MAPSWSYDPSCSVAEELMRAVSTIAPNFAIAQ